MFVGTVQVTAREVSESQLLAYCVVKINQAIGIEGYKEKQSLYHTTYNPEKHVCETRIHNQALISNCALTTRPLISDSWRHLSVLP